MVQSRPLIWQRASQPMLDLWRLRELYTKTEKSLYINWTFLCSIYEIYKVLQLLIKLLTNENRKRLNIEKNPNTHKHHAPGQGQAIITSAGTKRELLIGVKTHTLTCVVGIRWSWHLLTGYTESQGEIESKRRVFLRGETPPTANICDFFAWI